MSFSAVPREARSFSSHDIWGLGLTGAVFLRRDEDGTATDMELVATVEDGAAVEEATTEVGGSLIEGKDSSTGSDGGGLGLFRTSLRALLSNDTIGTICWSRVVVGFIRSLLTAFSGLAVELEAVRDLILCGCGTMAWKPSDLNPGGNVVMAAFDGMAEAGMGTNLDSLGREIGM